MKHTLPDAVHAQFMERVVAHGLSDHLDDLLAIAKPQLSLSYGDLLRDRGVGLSRIGGPPDVGEISEWKPENQYWVFYFQLNLSDITKAARFGLPDCGVLSVYSNSQVLADEIRLTHNRDLDSLNRCALPALSEYCDPDLRSENMPVCHQPPRRISILESVSLPAYAPEVIQDTDELENAYVELKHSYEGDIGDLSPDGSSYDLPHVKESQCLFNLYSGKYFEFGDCGNQAIMVRWVDDAFDFSEAISEYNE